MRREYPDNYREQYLLILNYITMETPQYVTDIINQMQAKIDLLEQEKKSLHRSLEIMIGWAEKSVAVKCGEDFLPRGFDTAKETLEYFKP